MLASGGNLSPGIVLSAYEQGVFPWYDEDPILWFSPDPRFVLYLDDFRIGKRTRRTLRGGNFTITFDRSFDDVIHGCRTVRKEGTGTWITEDMYDAYRELHRLGYTHSVEVWDGNNLVGGLYGVGIGSFFAGESMFSRVRDASKFAFAALIGYFDLLGAPMIDCQSYTGYLASFGAIEIPRDRFLAEIGPLQARDRCGPEWSTVDGGEMLRRAVKLSSENRCPR